MNKLVGFNDDQRGALEKKRGEIWQFYDDLKKYKQAPGKDQKRKLSERFDEIFTEKTCRNLEIPFWQYLNDRLSPKNAIPPLPDLIRLHARRST